MHELVLKGEISPSDLEEGDLVKFTTTMAGHEMILLTERGRLKKFKVSG